MKEIKDQFIKVRLTKSEKEKVAAYCDKHDLSISELIRRSLEVCFEEKGE